MSIKPILFNTEMVRAILDGRKTQTRRIIKGIDTLNVYRAEPAEDSYETLGAWDFFHGLSENGAMIDAIQAIKAPCSVGDVLWVRETWNHVKFGTGEWHYEYRADCDDPFKWSNGDFAEWRPSIHMPKEAARIFLKVKGVRVERLQDMNEEDAIAEGFADSPADTDSPLLCFSELWNSTINKMDFSKYCWSANPWVWVIEFERCEKPGWWCREAVLGP